MRRCLTALLVFFAVSAAPCLAASVLAKHEPLRGTYLGVLLTDGGSAPDIAELNQKAGKTHAVYAKFVDFREGFPRDWVNMIKANCTQASVHITLEPVTGFTNFFGADWGPGQSTYDSALAFATNCASAGLPIFVRFAHEANGFWYPWSPSYSDSDTVSNETYILGWRNFASLVHSNAPNVAMIWAPNQGNGGGELPFYTHTYPGDQYVDWVGMSLYNGSWYGNGNDVTNFELRDAIEKGYWQSNGNPNDDTEVDFYWTFSDPDNPDGHRKPMMIAETSAQFVPAFSTTAEIVIAAFESLTGAQVVATSEMLMDPFEAPTNWTWGPWPNLYFSNTTDRAEGTNAVRLGPTAGFSGGTYVGGNGRDVAPATNWAAFNGMSLWLKRDGSTNDDPSLRIGIRSGYGEGCGTATLDRVVAGTNYSAYAAYFSEMSAGPGFTWTNITACTLELLATNSSRRPASAFADDWRLASLTNEADQNWWVPWGVTAWTQSADAAVGTYALRIAGTDTNGDYYIGGSGCSPAAPEQNWTNSNAVVVFVKRGPGAANAKPDPKFRITLDSDYTETNGTEAVVEARVSNTNYTQITIPFQDFVAGTGFSWATVRSLKIEMSTSGGPDPYDLYLDQLGRALVTLTNETDNMRWKGDWIEQLYSLQDYTNTDRPQRVDISRSFRNLHMINWFQIRKFEDGMTKDFKIPEFDGASPTFSSYYARISNDYFLTNVLVDANNDGIDDAWQGRYFDSYTNSKAGPAEDEDKDGVNNMDEYVAGTDPTNRSSVFTFEGGTLVGEAARMAVQWGSESGRVYALDKTSNLASGFNGLATNLPATPSLNSYTDAASSVGIGFYRVRVVP